MRFLLLMRLMWWRTFLGTGLLLTIGGADCRPRVLSDNKDANRGSTGKDALSFWPAPSEPSEIHRPACKQPNEDEFFFPAGILLPPQSGAPFDEFIRRWFSKPLRRMDEPSLTCEAPSADTYRLLSLPTWGPPIAIRVILASTAARVEVRRLSGSGGYDPGTLVVASTKLLSTTDVGRFKNAIAHSTFWSMPTSDVDDILRMRDGTEWILEGRSGNRYHVAFRALPEPSKFRELCLLVLRLSEVETAL